jgi:hypothetical protein
MLDGRVAAFRRRGIALPPPMVVADSRFGDSKLMRHVATMHQGTFLVAGKSTYTFALPDGRQVKGSDLQQPSEWPWRESPHVPGVRYVRLRATSPTYGAVTLIIVHEPGVALSYLLCLETAISRPRLIRAWKRRHWIEHCFRTLKHLLATGASQVKRRCVRRPSGLAPDGVLGVVLYLAGHLQRSTHNRHFQYLL